MSRFVRQVKRRQNKALLKDGRASLVKVQRDQGCDCEPEFRLKGLGFMSIHAEDCPRIKPGLKLKPKRKKRNWRLWTPGDDHE